MASVELQILEAMEARLKVASVTLPGGVKTPPAGLTVVREKLGTIYPADVKDGPMMNISAGGQTNITRDHWKSPVTQRIAEVLVGIYALADTAKGATVTDPAYLWLIHSLQSEPRLGGLCNYISEENIDVAYTMFQDSTEIVAAREVKLWIYFHTRTDDPEVRANP